MEQNGFETLWETGQSGNPRRVLSREGENRMLDLDLPRFSPALKNEQHVSAFTGLNAGQLAGLESPAPALQAIEFIGKSGAGNFSPGILRRSRIKRMLTCHDDRLVL
jgi:hypothetical protein